jgi:hypothetical protein
MARWREPTPEDVRVIGRMETPDRAWAVEVYRLRGRPGERWYRIMYGDRVWREQLVIATVTALLAQEGVDLADFVEVPVRPAE